MVDQSGRPRKPRRRPATHQEAVQFRTVGGIIVAAGAVLLLFTGLQVPYHILPDIERARASAQWPTADGTITMSVVNPRGITSHGHVAYEYTVEGVRYRGHDVYMPSIAELTRPAFGVLFPELRSERQANERYLATRIREYPVGRRLPVFYHPGNPAMAVLVNHIGPGAMRNYVTMGLVVAAVAVGVMLLGWSIWKMARDGVPF